MANDLSNTPPEAFGFASFSELLAPRHPLLGEDVEDKESFREGLLTTLMPMSPYEAAVAENVIAIEWDLFQHRELRRYKLQKTTITAVKTAFRDAFYAIYKAEMDAHYEVFMKEGGVRNDWDAPYDFDSAAAAERVAVVVEDAFSCDAKVRENAYQAMREIGFDPQEQLSMALTSDYGRAPRHDEALQNLEKRRREVMRDYERLQMMRAIEGSAVEQ